MSKEKTMYDKRHVTIAGAGISGLITAILLRMWGFPVSVLEKSNDCGTRCRSGDLQGIEGWWQAVSVVDELKQLGIDLSDVITPTYKFTAFTPWNTYRIKSSTPAFYVVRRGPMKGTLDSYLKHLAQKIGVKIHFNHEVDVEKSSVDVDVIATGPSPKESKYIAYGMTFTTDLPDAIFAYFNAKFIKYGYSYFLINKGKATLAVSGTKGTLKHRKELLKKAEAFFRDKINGFSIRDRRYFGGYGVMSCPTSLKNSLVVGEADGLQDNLLGFGMGYAIRSAIDAAFQIANETVNYEAERASILADVTATKVWAKIVYGFLGNIGLEIICFSARIAFVPTLRFFYRQNIFTRFVAKIFSL